MVHLLDPKRAYNIDISLARFRMTHDHIRDAILEMDESVLDPDVLAQLLKIVPAPEEVEAVLVYSADNDPKMLANAEKFCLCLSHIPRIQQR